MQQGDPLGPLLFAMVIQQLVNAVREACPNLSLNCWYLDDGVIAGSAKDVLKALEIIQRLGPDLGMDLNLKKNELVKFNKEPDAFPPECERFYRNFTLLGSPIGDGEFCSEYITTYTRKRVRHALSSLDKVRDPQVFHFLVRCCASLCKVVHLLRTVPPCLCTQALEEFDLEIRKSFSRGVGVLFPEQAWTQVGLSSQFGGCGLRKAVEHSAGAYVASVANCAKLDGWRPDLAEGWCEALRQFCTRSGWDEARAAQASSQFVLSQAVDKATFSALVQSSSTFDRARLLAEASEGASSWLTVIPSSALNLVYDAREFTTLLRFWLGMPVFDSVCACPWCGVAQDCAGYHALTCKKTGLKVLRHNALRELFLHHCSLGGIEAERETPGLLPDSPGERPADVLLPSSFAIPNFDSQPICLDFAVAHTQQNKYILRASVKSGAAAADYEENVKDKKYADECQKQGLRFVPMVVEVFGAWGEKAAPIIKFICRAVANRKGLDEDRADVYFRRACSVVLQRVRHNARALLRHRDPNAPAVDGPVPHF